MQSASKSRLDSFLHGRFGDFSKFEEDFESLLTKISRDLPADIYEELRDELVSIFPSSLKGVKTRLKLVVDSNVVVKDAFRVAKGKPSSTRRLFASEFVELLAPPDISDEVHREIEHDLPKGVSREAARAQADALLSEIKTVRTRKGDALARARELINKEAPEDVPFLAIAIDTGAEAVVSYDKRAFDAQHEVKRWELSDTASVVVTYESGTLSFFVVAASVEAMISASSVLIVGIIRAISEILALIVGLVTAIISGATDALAKIPDWAWVVVTMIGIGLLLGLALDENLRKQVSDSISNIIDVSKKAFDSVVATLRCLWTASEEVITMLWTAFSPVLDVLVIFAGVLLRRIMMLFAQMMTLSTSG